MKTPVLFIQGGGEGAHDVDNLLAASLQKELGAGYEVCFPRMPRESEPDMTKWKEKIATELQALAGSVVLVGHSVGGAALLKYLAEEKVTKPIAGLFLLAVPSWDEGNWNFEEFKLPRDLAARLSQIPKIFLYHNREDEIAPVGHLALHAARLPHSVVREGKTGGHQFDNDLATVADDIRRVTQASAGAQA